MCFLFFFVFFVIIKRDVILKALLVQSTFRNLRCIIARSIVSLLGKDALYPWRRDRTVMRLMYYFGALLIRRSLPSPRWHTADTAQL